MNDRSQTSVWVMSLLRLSCHCVPLCVTPMLCVAVFLSSSQAASSYIIRTPQPHRSSQSQPARGRDEEQDDIVSADVEEVWSLTSVSISGHPSFCCPEIASALKGSGHPS